MQTTRIDVEDGVGMSVSEDLIADLLSRIKAFTAGVPGAVLGSDAIAVAYRLLQQATGVDDRIPLPVAQAVAWLHWCRYLALPEGQDQDDLQVAVRLFTPIAQVEPDALPEPLRLLLVPHDRLSGPKEQATVAVILLHHVMQRHDPAALNQAINLFLAALRTISDDHPARAETLSNLGGALRLRFERTGSIADLDKAINIGRQAVAAAFDDHHGRYVSNLAAALAIRFARAGAMSDVDEAISLCRRVIATFPDDHADGALFHLSILGNALHARFERSGAVEDLDEAITFGRRAVAATAADDPNHGASLSNLGVSLRLRFDHTGAVAALDEAVALGRQAVAATPDDHPDRAGNLSNLGAALLTRFEELEATADIDEAIDVSRRAIEITPLDDPQRASYLSNLGTALQVRFERAGTVADLEEAIRAGRLALAATPDHHPDRASYLLNLGFGLRNRFGLAGVVADLDEAIRGWMEVTRSAVASVTTRLTAAKRWARSVASQEGPAASLEAHAEAIGLLPLLAWRGISHRDQQHLLGAHAVLVASDAAGSAIAARHPDEAIELLEAGRGVYWSQLLGTRTDLTNLAQIAPDLAGQLRDCRTILDQPIRPR